MTSEELVSALQTKIAGYVNLASYVTRPLITIVVPGRKRPFPAKGFPRAELLTVNSKGEAVWLYDAERLLKSLERAEIS